MIVEAGAKLDEKVEAIHLTESEDYQAQEIQFHKDLNIKLSLPSHFLEVYGAKIPEKLASSLPRDESSIGYALATSDDADCRHQIASIEKRSPEDVQSVL